MEKKENSKKSWRGKLLHRYRMIVVNETTFEEQFYFRLSRLNLIILMTLLIATIMIGTFSIISYTPVKEFIPGYPSSKLRLDAMQNTFRLDSIINVARQQDLFLESIKETLLGKKPVDEIKKASSVPINNTKEKVNFIPPNKEDSTLRERVTNEDKYNFKSSSQNNFIDFLFPPAKGKVSQIFDLEKKHFGVDIVLKENYPVKSVLEGRVIFSEWTAQTGYVIIINHPKEMLSVYKHNSFLTKEQGELVFAGEVIANAGNTGEFSTGPHLHFELWLSGYPVDPFEFINFSW